MQEKLINPITFLKPGQCPNCLSNLIVHECEEVMFYINEDGLPVGGLDVAQFTCELHCPICSKIYSGAKKGMYFHIESKYPELMKEKVLVNIENPFGYFK